MGTAIPLTHYLVLSAALFSIGIFGVLIRRNAVAILISLELILNAANINLVAFSRYADRGPMIPGLAGSAGLDGQVLAIFVIVLAACEAAIGLAICINIFNAYGSADVNRADTLSG